MMLEFDTRLEALVSRGYYLSCGRKCGGIVQTPRGTWRFFVNG